MPIAKLMVLVVLAPAILALQLQQPQPHDPNDEPFLPIFPDPPYNPKLMKRGLERQQQQHQLQYRQVSSRESNIADQPLYPPTSSYDAYSAKAQQQNQQQPQRQQPPVQGPQQPSPPLGQYYGYTVGPYDLASAYAGPPAAQPYVPAYPSYYYQQPFFYPNYYNYPYVAPPSGYHGAKHPDDGYDEEKRKFPPGPRYRGGGSQRNRIRSSDGLDGPSFIDGNNYLGPGGPRDLDVESSSSRGPPTRFNLIPDEVVPVSLPKATFRLVSIKNDAPSDELIPAPRGYVRVQQLEELMRRALQRLLAQNAVQLNKNAEQQAALISGPSSVAKAGLGYIVRPTIITSPEGAQQLASAVGQLLQNQASISKAKQQQQQQSTPQQPSQQPQKTTTTVTLQQSPGIYIPPLLQPNSPTGPTKGELLQGPGDYNDYDGESVTIKSLGLAAVTPTPRTFLYSTYRPTQKTNLDDVNFGEKQPRPSN